MNNNAPVPIDDEMDEYPEMTQADFDRAIFRIGLQPAQPRQETLIVIDADSEESIAQ